MVLPQIIFLTTLLGALPDSISTQILYLMHHGKTSNAVALYEKEIASGNTHDFSLLQQAATLLLEEGMRSNDPEIELMCMYGAGIAPDTRFLPILEKGLQNKDPRIQLAALNFLGRQEDDEAKLLVQEMLSSPYLLIRLEAALILAHKKEGKVVEHLESLYYKVQDPVRVVFPEILAPLDTRGSLKMLQRLMSDGTPEVRVAAILFAALGKKDELLTQLRSIAGRPDYSEQEAACFALGELKDSASKDLLLDLSKRNHESVRLAALNALTKLEDDEAGEKLKEEAKKGNLFAIALLSDDKSASDLLKELATSNNKAVSLNATTALLKMGKMPPLEALEAILKKREDGTFFVKQYSQGKALFFWKNAYLPDERKSFQLELKVLQMALELDEEDFVKVAELVFEKGDKALIGPLVELLENQRTDRVVHLLRTLQTQTQRPFTRIYATLALYRLFQEKSDEEILIAWVKDVKNHPLIQFKEDDEKERGAHPTLTPQETSQLLISTFETLASSHSIGGISALLHAIAYGNQKNRYALAGLLIRTAE